MFVNKIDRPGAVRVPSPAGDAADPRPAAYRSRPGRAALRAALAQLAEQDPLINARQSGGELSVSLCGEVQKEVITATLAGDYGVDVTFRETTVIYIERVAGSGLEFKLDVDVRSVPMYVCKTTDNFAAMMTRYVRRALAQDPRGWRVTECLVTLTECRRAASVPGQAESDRGRNSPVRHAPGR